MASSSQTSTPKKTLAAPKTAEKKAFRHKPKQSYNIYIVKLVKKIDEDAGLSGNAKAAACSMVENFLAELFRQTKNLKAKDHKATVQDRDVMSALKILFTHLKPEEFKDEFETPFNEPKSGLKDQYKKSDKKTKSEKAGLIFPVARILTSMRRYRIADRTSELAAVLAATALQVLMQKLLEEANEIRKVDKDKPVRVTAKHLKKAVDDEGMTHLFPGTFHNGGFREHIEEALVPKKSLKRFHEESAASVPEATKTKSKNQKIK